MHLAKNHTHAAKNHASTAWSHAPSAKVYVTPIAERIELHSETYLAGADSIGVDEKDNSDFSDKSNQRSYGENPIWKNMDSQD